MFNPKRNYSPRPALAALVAFWLLTMCFAPAGAEPDGKALMENRCTMCHDLPDPETLSGEQWGITLQSMAGYAGLSDSEKSAILDYVTSHEQKAVTITSMVQEQKIFERKCSLCHSTNRVLLMKLTPESREHIVMRMQERAPDMISASDVHKILEYLNHGAPGSTKPGHKSVEGGPAALFRERCTACHSDERVITKIEKGRNQGTGVVWGHIVNRMREKAPDWITETEAEQILQYLGSLKQSD